MRLYTFDALAAQLPPDPTVNGSRVNIVVEQIGDGEWAAEPVFHEITMAEYLEAHGERHLRFTGPRPDLALRQLIDWMYYNGDLPREKEPVKKPRLKRDWAGRYVRLLVDTQNIAGDVFLAGEILKVYKSRGGLYLERVEICQCCRFSRFQEIAKVSESNVELLPHDYTPTRQTVIDASYAGLRRQILQEFIGAMSLSVAGAIALSLQQDKSDFLQEFVEEAELVHGAPALAAAYEMASGSMGNHS